MKIISGNSNLELSKEISKYPSQNDVNSSELIAGQANFGTKNRKDIFKKNPSEFDRLKNGDNKLIGFFMGQAMRTLKGKADPKSIQEIINKLIG